jgi:sulfate permease, SulP family
VAPQLPGALIALVVMTVIVAVFGLADRGVSVFGPVSEGLPRLGIPQVELGDYVRLLPGALAICGITLADGLLVGRNYAEKRDYGLDANQELFAFGAANVAAGVSGSMTIGSSGSRTAAMDGMNSRSLVAAGVVAIVLVFLASLLALLPNAALGGIVASAVLSLVESAGCASCTTSGGLSSWLPSCAC